MAGSVTEKSEEGAEFTQHLVTVVKDHHLKYPDIFLEVFVATDDPYEEAQFASMFTRSGCKRAESPEKADFVVFTGGADVDPALYGEKPHPTTSIDANRDSKEMDLYLLCLDQGIPMLGICRGAQFLHVMNGGKLFQHVDHHVGDHTMLDLSTKETIHKVSSVHHQMVNYNVSGGMEVIATVCASQNRWKTADRLEKGHHADIEAFWYRDTCCLGIQGHPEYADYSHFAVWTLKQIEQFFLLNPDTDWDVGCSRRRLRADILDMRIAKTKEPLLLENKMTKGVK